MITAPVERGGRCASACWPRCPRPVRSGCSKGLRRLRRRWHPLGCKDPAPLAGFLTCLSGGEGRASRRFVNACSRSFHELRMSVCLRPARPLPDESKTAHTPKTSTLCRRLPCGPHRNRSHHCPPGDQPGEVGPRLTRVSINRGGGKMRGPVVLIVSLSVSSGLTGSQVDRSL